MIGLEVHSTFGSKWHRIDQTGATAFPSSRYLGLRFSCSLEENRGQENHRAADHCMYLACRFHTSNLACSSLESSLQASRNIETITEGTYSFVRFNVNGDNSADYRCSGDGVGK